MPQPARSPDRDRALRASAVLPTFGFMSLGLVTILVLTLLGLQPGDLVSPRGANPMAVPTPELTITTPPRTPAPGVPSVHLADMQQVVALGPPTRPTAKRPPARPGGSAPRPRVEPPTPPSPPPPPPPGPGPGPGPGVRSDCRDATPDGGITVGCLRFCRAKLDKTGDVPGVCRRWCRNVARDSDRVTGWYRWCRPARVSGVPIWAYSAASGSTTVTKA